MNKSNIVFLLLILVQIGCTKEEGSTDNPSIADRPNILLVIADDVGTDAAPGYDEGLIKPNMPNLQKLASEGITFRKVWAYPVCSPTRASILTGRYGYRTGVLNAEEESTISASEKTIQSFIDENTDQAYSHSLIGKWHLSSKDPDRPTDMGIDYFAGLLGGSVSDYYSWPFVENGASTQSSSYITTKITDLAIDWITTQSKPWFCWVAYTAAHTPFHLPPDVMHSQGSLSTDEASIEANPLPYFLAMTESIDYEIGRLMASIPQEERENTTVIFIGDNGSPSKVIQSPYLSTQAKGTLYEGGVHVPMIISGKGVMRKNVIDQSLINSTDLFSTIAEIAGANLSEYEDSQSFYSLFTSAGNGTRKYNYSEIVGSTSNKSGFTIRDIQYKYIEFDNGQKRFYDLSLDPYEQDNLISKGLTTEQETVMQSLVNEANAIRS